jgi:hypothetical protein
LLRFFVSVSLVAVLAGCASPAPPAPAPAPVTAAAAGLRGTIVAIRRVPAALLPVRLDWPAADRQQSGSEFIVKLDDGSTLAVVQPGPAELQIGQRVGIVRGEPARLIALPHTLAAR